MTIPLIIIALDHHHRNVADEHDMLGVFAVEISRAAALNALGHNRSYLSSEPAPPATATHILWRYPARCLITAFNPAIKLAARPGG